MPDTDLPKGQAGISCYYQREEVPYQACLHCRFGISTPGMMSVVEKIIQRRKE